MLGIRRAGVSFCSSRHAEGECYDTVTAYRNIVEASHVIDLIQRNARENEPFNLTLKDHIRGWPRLILDGDFKWQI
jgi:hypothetical protein